MTKPLKRVAITGAAGQIAYSLLFRIGNGELFGDDTPVALHLLELEDVLPHLRGTVMELEDCALPLLKEIIIGSDPFKVFQDVDLALLVGSKPRGPGMERKDLLVENGKIFVEQGAALNKVANPDCKVVVVGNPCNTNCWIAREKASNLKRENFFAMTRLDENRARSQLAGKLSVSVPAIKYLALWGNHSSTQVPDIFHVEVNGKPLSSIGIDQKWLEEEFIRQIQSRGADVIKARGKSSAASAAHCAIETARFVFGMEKGDDWFSVGQDSANNTYGIREDLIYSYPSQYKNGKVVPLANIENNAFIQERMKISEKELEEELDQVWFFLRGSS